MTQDPLWITHSLPEAICTLSRNCRSRYIRPSRSLYIPIAFYKVKGGRGTVYPLILAHHHRPTMALAATKGAKPADKDQIVFNDVEMEQIRSRCRTNWPEVPSFSTLQPTSSKKSTDGYVYMSLPYQCTVECGNTWKSMSVLEINAENITGTLPLLENLRCKIFAQGCTRCEQICIGVVTPAVRVKLIQKLIHVLPKWVNSSNETSHASLRFIPERHITSYCAAKEAGVCPYGETCGTFAKRAKPHDCHKDNSSKRSKNAKTCHQCHKERSSLILCPECNLFFCVACVTWLCMGCDFFFCSSCHDGWLKRFRNGVGNRCSECVQVCKECGQHASAGECTSCGGGICDEHDQKCSDCKRKSCAACTELQSLNDCWARVCDTCFPTSIVEHKRWTCDVCRKSICAGCKPTRNKRFCSACRRLVCSDCRQCEECSKCNETFCGGPADSDDDDDVKSSDLRCILRKDDRKCVTCQMIPPVMAGSDDEC